MNQTEADSNDESSKQVPCDDVTNICNNNLVSDTDEYKELSCGDYIQDGECELCKRYMKLTWHHLIPKLTGSKMKPRLLKNLSDYLCNNMEIANEICSGEAITIPALSSYNVASTGNLRVFLGSYTASLC